MLDAPKPARTRDLPPETRAIYAEKLRRHRTYTRTVASNADWHTTPYFVSIETLMLCNAACEFCPYPTLDRKGLRMPDDLFAKIVDDLAAKCPRGIPNFTLNRVSEPFLDARTFDFARYLVSKFPTTKINRVTNGSALTDKVLDKLIDQGSTGYIKTSFNDHRPDHYEKTMQLPFERTFRNIKRLHERHAAGDFDTYTMVGRVGDGTLADAEFVEWVRREFPRFHPIVSPRFDWMGYTHSFSSGVLGQKCAQWFELHFLADGKEAMCCIDSTGEYGRGDANVENAYDIYMHPTRQAMRAAKSRRDLDVCRTCSALV